ncbi:Porphobilinogen deaminase [Sporotomaculum syntrophicum]|uniref:Porphobilinogen deaminase n=1 Tax=Sporotomaculum syntrophicum TaxID=182264 RepID=A0A9D3AX74_9FIRM|nr:hydroxymethylbilane synthase [Sporotomaculum syntrophicum]KAF1084717.1 Porphobilinogen deaminase [Sporotomaculum syntrophicum]
MVNQVIIGSRDSDLAMWQASWVAEALQQAYPDRSFQIKGIKTKGDNILDVALAKIGDKGLFTKELEAALLNGTIHMAVHSMKDLPTQLPEGLDIGAVCEREYPGDVLISRNNLQLADLKKGARVGTSSLRRRAQLLHYRPDLQMVDIRGNLNTRLRKFKELELDALVLAYAGIKRLGFEELITQLIPFDICLPAVGQGSLGVELTSTDTATRAMLAHLDHRPSRTAIAAERAFMQRLEGGCQVPIGAYSQVEGELLTLTGTVFDLHGQTMLRHSITGSAVNAKQLGIRLAEVLIDHGAEKILHQARQEFGRYDK